MMKPFHTLISLLLLLVMSISCAQKSAKTTFKITAAGFGAVGSDLEAVSTGGLMVWGVSGSGDSFGRILSSSNNTEIELPNGNWRFFAMAWNGASQLDATNLRCAQSPTLTLDGNPVSVPLSLTQAGCDVAVFKGHTTTPATAQFKLMTCTDTTNITASSGVTYDPSKYCTNDPSLLGRVANKAPIMSVRVHLMEHESTSKVSSIGSSLSRCIDVSTETFGTTPAQSFKLPIGLAGFAPFRMRLDYYVNSNDCGVSGEQPIRVDLPRGFHDQLPGQKYFVEGTNTHLLVMQLPDSVICNGRTAKGVQVTHDFAGGNGSIESPLLICSPAQLYAMHDATLTNSFRLMTDINLNPYTKALANGTTRYAELPDGQKDCWDESANWQPLGGWWGDTVACSGYTTTLFQGSFDGGGYTISGLRMRLENKSEVGFFGNWKPTNPNGKFINDLNFAKVEITANSEVGTLAGKIDGTGFQGLVKNIKVSGADIEARFNGMANVGGVVGKSAFNSFKVIKIENSWVKSNGDRAGGVIGDIMDFQYFREIFARSTNVLQSQSNPVDTIGGLAGYVGAGSALATGLDQLSHDGMIISSGTSIGGLFGSLFGGSSGMNHFYANSSIYAAGDPTRSVGGIVGYNSHNGFISHGYFSGSIIDDCSTTCHRSALSGQRVGSYTFGNFKYISSAIYPSAAVGTTDAIPVGDIHPNSSAEVLFNPSGSFPAYSSHASNSWVHNQGSLPYLTKEQHPCGLAENIASVSAQAVSRGSESNPIRICNRFQLDSILAQSGSRHMVLETGINMSETPGVIVVAGATLSGEKGSLFGYFNTGYSGTGNIAPITMNGGTIKNLNIANTLITEGSAGVGTQFSALVGTNNGTIKNVRILSSKLSNITSNVKLSGVANINNGTGLIDEVANFTTFTTVLGSVSGITNLNAGKIVDSIAENGIYSNSAISKVAGIANTNGSGAVIERVTVKSKLNTNNTVLSESAFGVLTNSGVLQDIHIDSRTQWEAKLDLGLENSTLARDNNASGVILGAIISGVMREPQSSSTVVTDAEPNTTPIETNFGSVKNVANLIPSGRVIYSTTTPGDFACSDAAPIYVKLTSGYPVPFNTYFSSPEPLLTNYKYVWLVVETNNTTSSYLISNTLADSPLRLEIAGVEGDFDYSTGFTCTNFLSATRVTLIQDLNSDLSQVLGSAQTAPNFNGFFPNQFLISPTSFQDPDPVANPNYWRQSGVVLNENFGSADWDAILTYFSSLLSGGTPSAPGVWGIRDEGGGEYRMRLFKNDN